MQGQEGVHISHCCDQHWCKYNDQDCPVVKGTHKQSGPCQVCGETQENYYGDGNDIGYYDTDMVWHPPDVSEGIPIPSQQWKRTDPRLAINKRAEIVILRPAVSGGFWAAGMGSVETKNAYSVLTSFDDHPLVGEDEEWDIDWRWSLAP